LIYHGIPKRPRPAGDIINLDTVYLDGFHGDCSEMFVAGEPRLMNHDTTLGSQPVRNRRQRLQGYWNVIEDYIVLGLFHGAAQLLRRHGIGQTFTQSQFCTTTTTNPMVK
jgi:methionine aminopeptidase